MHENCSGLYEGMFIIIPQNMYFQIFDPIQNDDPLKSLDELLVTTEDSKCLILVSID